MRIVQIGAFALILVLILAIILHNLFAPNERDIPHETIFGLLKLLPAAGGLPSPIQEWRNETKN